MRSTVPAAGLDDRLVDVTPPPGTETGVLALFGNAAPIEHVAVLLLLTPALLAAAVTVLRWSEFSAAAESDV